MQKVNEGGAFFVLSMGDCAKAQYATNVQNARRKIQRGQDGWRYAHLNAETNKPLRVLYVLKPGEWSYSQYCDVFAFVFSVQVLLQKIQ